MQRTRPTGGVRVEVEGIRGGAIAIAIAISLLSLAVGVVVSVKEEAVPGVAAAVMFGSLLALVAFITLVKVGARRARLRCQWMEQLMDHWMIGNNTSRSKKL